MTAMLTAKQSLLVVPTVGLVVLIAIASSYFSKVNVARAAVPCEQLSPNPNPANTRHNMDSRDGCNELDNYENFGTLINSGKLDNAGEIRNLGKLLNLGKFNNFGEITNVQSRSGHIRNDGTMNNFGNVTGFGATDNNGILNNYGTFNTGDFGKNVGVINNHADATLSSAQRYTNDGVINNSPGATIRTKIGWINNGLISNNGVINFKRARFLINKGVLINAKGATIFTNYEISNAGMIRVDGVTTANGTITNVSRFIVSESGKIEGSGEFIQTDGVTVVDGEIAQDTINIAGGKLSGNGTLVAVVNNDGGMLAPGGTEFGIIQIAGEYRQTADGDYSVDIGGARAVAEHDVLVVSGEARLGGELRVGLYEFGGGPFSPAEGDRFDILRADSIVGEFGSLRLAPLAPPLEWRVSYLADVDGTDDVVRLSVTRAGEQ